LECSVYVSCFISGRKNEEYTFVKHIEIDFVPVKGTRWNIDLRDVTVATPVVESVYYYMEENKISVFLNSIEVQNHSIQSLLMNNLRKNGWIELS
jgi:hypothetical protein